MLGDISDLVDVIFGTSSEGQEIVRFLAQSVTSCNRTGYVELLETGNPVVAWALGE